MIEAFEIGVSLALRDGVSEGIAAARRDMALVEAAIRGTGVSLRDLQRTGMRALDSTRSAAVQMGERDRVSPDTPVAVNAGGPREVVSDVFGQGITFSGFASDETKAVSGGDVPAVRAGTAAGVVARAWMAPLPQGRLPDVGEAPNFVPQAPQGFRPAAMTPDRGRPASETPGGGVRAPERPGGQGMAPGGGSTPTAPAATGPAAPVSISIAGPQTRAPDVAGPGQAPGAVDSPVVLPMGQVLLAAGLGTAAAPFWPDQRAAAACSERRSEAAPERSMPDRPPAGGQTAMQGDVFLDGALVGRWMSRFLTKQAGRAAAGPTGFDPRRNAVLPGPTIGL